ncbi:UDP-2,4-diacetamido-2,4,6-trideoxy-beta-L-altropyranose hydrolase [Jeotgalibacillus sp. R-1-5s-1]|uniref:UDP-2,4-diacetamido-2,4, 6-trideoxy-beta-L-altropyranose hydrolase n=1 Tax=Jeotgalibacillus sp. R-1-5s-1 TaxID=2555897 RepID=UPI00141A8CBB|nr:UDP-2,4-diacetamido-2,4,6-trideoxy-beta-L-altropyranose hydrolase [Jeotgalibacillus sp. R-1-5s-1]
MKVLIFTEGGSQSGFGHISRCCSIYDELERRAISVKFIICGDKKHISETLKNRKYELYNWTELQNIKRINLKDMICIIDSYKASSAIYNYIANQSIKILCIDDYNRLNYPEGIVLNPSIYTDEHYYPENMNIKYLLGKEYIILRDAFYSRHTKIINKDVQKVLITLGGSDIRNLTPKIMDCLKVYPHISKNVVIGSGFNNINEIKQKCDCKTNLHYNLIDEDMKNFIDVSDIVITAAGQTVYELLSRRTPFIPIQVVDNQKYTTKGLIKFNLVNKILNWEKVDFEKDLMNEFNILMNYDERVALNKRYKTLIDTSGIKKIVTALLES